MPLFDVSVPVRAFVQDERPSHLAILPERFQLDGLQFERDDRPTNPQTVYTCHATVRAPSTRAAIDDVVLRASEVVWLMATWGGSYRVDASLAIATESLDPEPAGNVGPVTRTRDVPLRFSVAELRTVEFECHALRQRLNWPPWLATCLELNYLAVTSHDARPALVIHWSILELLADQHAPTVTILGAIDSRQRKQLLSAVTNVLRPVLNVEAVERLVSRLASTQTQGEIDRIHTVLSTLGVDVPVDAVREVGLTRHKFAHGASQDRNHDLAIRAEDQAASWAQAALRTAIQQFVPRPD